MHRVKAPTIFLSYASDDREFVESLASALSTLGVSVWYAPGELSPGDSIVDKIDKAMESIRFALLVVSASFLSKAWPLRELHALTALGIKDKSRRLIPILHGVSDQEFLKAVPMMADIKWLSSDRGLDWIVCGLRVILAEPGDQALPRQQAVVEAKGSIKRHDTLNEALEIAEDGATIVLYPGEYEAPTLINKRVSIVARGLARDTIVRIPKGETIRITSSEVEIDGLNLIVGTASERPGEEREDFELFLAGSSYPRVSRGDTMLAVTRNQRLGQILFKNCVIDAKNHFRLIIATDSQVAIRNTTLKNSESGISVRHGGRVEVVACALNNMGAESEYHSSLLILDSVANGCRLISRHDGHIEIRKSEFLDSVVHAYSEGKISIANCNFTQRRQKGSTEAFLVYGTHYSHVSVQDSAFDGGSSALYVYGGSLLSARRVTVQRAGSFGIRYSEGCSGDVEDCRVLDCLGEGIRVQKGANPQIRRCVIESNRGVGIVSEMSGNLNITECHIRKNRQGGISADVAAMTIRGTRVFLNDGPGIQIGNPSLLEIVDCEVGQNAHGQLIIGGVEWYPPVSLRDRLSDLFSRRRNIRIIRTTLY